MNLYEINLENVTSMELRKELFLTYKGVASVVNEASLSFGDEEYYIYHSLRILKKKDGIYEVVDISNDRKDYIKNKYILWLLIESVKKLLLNIELENQEL